MISRKRLKYQQKQILDLLRLSIVKTVNSGYTFCHLENCFYLLHVSFKIVTQRRIVYPIHWNTEKNTTLNTKGLKRGYRSFILLSLPHCSKSIIETEKHCGKHAKS